MIRWGGHDSEQQEGFFNSVHGRWQPYRSPSTCLPKLNSLWAANYITLWSGCFCYSDAECRTATKCHIDKVCSFHNSCLWKIHCTFQPSKISNKELNISVRLRHKLRRPQWRSESTRSREMYIRMFERVHFFRADKVGLGTDSVLVHLLTIGLSLPDSISHTPQSRKHKEHRQIIRMRPPKKQSDDKGKVGHCSWKWKTRQQTPVTSVSLTTLFNAHLLLNFM